MKSILQDWVMKLPLREQETMLTFVRGCDLTPKIPLDLLDRQIIGWIRMAILNPADSSEVGIEEAFIQYNFPRFKPSEFGHYPFHWVMNLIHCLQVIGYRSPNKEHATDALNSYYAFVHSLEVVS